MNKAILADVFVYFILRICPPPLKFRVILLSCEVILLDIIDRLGLPSIRRFKKTNLLNKINYKIIIINNLLKICKCTIYTTHSSVLFISLNNVLYLLVAIRLVVPLCIGKWMKKMFNSKKWGEMHWMEGKVNYMFYEVMVFKRYGLLQYG